MGILNVTPDSFYDGGKYLTPDDIVRRAASMLENGADIIDIGGYSSRPGAENIPIEEEIARVASALKIIKKEFSECIVSVDTFRSEVAKIAAAEGAEIINDISGGELDKKMFETVAELKLPYVLMHMKGSPATMAKLNQYDNLIGDMLQYFQQKIHRLNELGVWDIIIDPGIGFSKNSLQNFHLITQLDIFSALNLPVLLGVSRKSFIYKTLNVSQEEALNGTTIVNTISLLKNLSIIRVHDVREAKQIISLLEKLKN
ncbi:MAG: dihydropteroate synthase [Sporocytophaga sp.]|uniref:dihydropteroate synthase n=1 Tax=Sporocytophaga sp. TaxID=2231183 RepID=UPI001AFE8817|nr:dihydropteroate synthase [Sporocytophaga sp.]MBO9699604.1 dihydropteroate synthase [Sporocytophaga sp.]